MPSMRAPGGWRVEPITVDRGAEPVHLYRVSRHDVHVGEVPAGDDLVLGLAALGVPVDQLYDEE